MRQCSNCLRLSDNPDEKCQICGHEMVALGLDALTTADSTQGRNHPTSSGESSMNMIRCPNCGLRNHQSVHRCLGCSVLLPHAKDAQHIEEEQRILDIAPHLTDAERQRIVEEERLRQHIRAYPSAGIDKSTHRAMSARTTYDPKGDMVRAAVIGLLLGVIGLGVGLIYTASADSDKKVFGRQLIAWSAAGVLALFVLFLTFPSLSPTAPALAECVVCNGTGIADCPICVNGMASNPLTGMNETCTFCNGVGSTTCTFCNGTGKNR